MSPDRSLATYVDDLQAGGRYTFTRDEALAALDCTPEALRQAAGRLFRRKRLVMPRRGLFVIVPLEHRAAAAPPPSWYTDDLLQHAGVDGYVGLLSAAALYGATHHAPQVWQVVVDRQIRPITVGRSRWQFVYKRAVRDVPVRRRQTATGTMPISTPEVTALDLVRYVEPSGGVDAVATVFSELGEQLDANALAHAAAHFPRTVAQRVGWLLDRVGHSDVTAALHGVVGRTADTTDLWPALVADAPADPRWHVRAARDVEVDG